MGSYMLQISTQSLSRVSPTCMKTSSFAHTGLHNQFTRISKPAMRRLLDSSRNLKIFLAGISVLGYIKKNLVTI